MKKEETPTLSPEDFLTGSDLSQQDSSPLHPGQIYNEGGDRIMQPPPDLPTPPSLAQQRSEDLHNEPQVVTAAARAAMDQTAEQAFDRANLAEERVQDEVNTIKNRYADIPKSPKDSLKELLAQGELRKTFKLFGHTWTFRALDQGDLLLAMDDLKDSITTEAGRMTAVIFSKVVYAIEEIDETPVYRLFPDIVPNQYPSKIEYIVAVKRALRAYLIGMPPMVIDNLYFKYMEVEVERDEALEKLKNS